MDEMELNLWRMCDVNIMNALQVILNFAYSKNREMTKRWYRGLRDRYNWIDIGLLDDRFPVETIKKVRSKLDEMGAALGNHEELTGIIEETKKLALGFKTPGYEEYRRQTKEDERLTVEKFLY